MSGAATAAERLLHRQPLIIGGALLVICLLSWWYLLNGAGTGMSMAAMTTWQFPPPIGSHGNAPAWSTQYWLIMLLMWWVMMVAMMVPSAAPMVLLYARVYRQGQIQARNQARNQDQVGLGVTPTAMFLAGYLLAWFTFSLAATLLQWGLEHSGLVHAMFMWSSSITLSALFLLVAGLYQLSPLKQACLSHCRAPATYLSPHWKKGQIGALQMGISHGLYCVGCCWLLMLLLFVGGTMNLVWIAGLALFVLIEKLAPRGMWIARTSGMLMIAAGAWLLSASTVHSSSPIPSPADLRVVSVNQTTQNSRYSSALCHPSP